MWLFYVYVPFYVWAMIFEFTNKESFKRSECFARSFTIYSLMLVFVVSVIIRAEQIYPKTNSNWQIDGNWMEPIFFGLILALYIYFVFCRFQFDSVFVGFAFDIYYSIWVFLSFFDFWVGFDPMLTPRTIGYISYN